MRLATGGAIAALVAVVSFFAISQLGSASERADSPEAAVQAPADAVNAEDLDAARAAQPPPGERDALADPIDELLDEFARVGNPDRRHRHHIGPRPGPRAHRPVDVANIGCR